MSLLIATGGVAYITNMFQKRSSFVEALKEEWRDIIATKSALFAYTQLERPTLEQYIATFCRLSETIDNMRSVYQNVGETGDLDRPLPVRAAARHAPRPADARSAQEPQRRTPRRATSCRDAILQSFYALRETFLEELDLEEPDHPLLISSGRRGQEERLDRAARAAPRTASAARQDRVPPPDPRIDELLAQLYDKESATAKPWRQPAGDAAGRPARPTAARPR